MVDSIKNNFIIKPSAFRSFHSEEMIKSTNEFMNETHVFRKRYFLNDFSISIQAGTNLYSNPRHFSSIYYSYELGYPSKEVSYLKQFAEDNIDYTNTVYAYVPWQYVIYLMMEFSND